MWVWNPGLDHQALSFLASSIGHGLVLHEIIANLKFFSIVNPFLSYTSVRFLALSWRVQFIKSVFRYITNSFNLRKKKNPPPTCFRIAKPSQEFNRFLILSLNFPNILVNPERDVRRRSSAGSSWPCSYRYGSCEDSNDPKQRRHEPRRSRRLSPLTKGCLYA